MVRWKEDDMNDGEYETAEAGIYEVEVKEVEEKRSKNDDRMWLVKFKSVETGKIICFDNIVFSKNGKGIAFKKMSILGIEKGDDGWFDCESQDLIGLRCRLELEVNKYKDKNGNDKENLKPKNDFGFMGYEALEPTKNEF